MRKVTFLLVLISFLSIFVVFAEVQVGQAENSVQSQDNFEDQHKDKKAIFLLYDVSIDLAEDYSYVSKMHKKLKIIKEEAKDMGEISLSYIKGREKVLDLKAHTITPDGKKHRYSKLQDVKMYENYSMYSDTREKIVTFSNSVVGSILEYEFTILTEKEVIKDAFWESFDFIFTIPAKEINLRFTFPKSIDMHYKEFNIKYKPEITEDETTITYSWHIENLYIPGTTENYLLPLTPDNVGGIVEFSTIKEWSDVSDWYYSLIQKNKKINSQIEETVKEITKECTTTKDKVRAVLHYINKNFRYLSMGFGNNTLEPHPTDEVFRNKYGDCKDTSLLCHIMLELAGVKSNLALFNTEDYISDPKYDPPFPTLFNHVLLLIDDPEEGSYYVDPLLESYDIGEYPLYYQQAYTFIITEDGGRFGRLPVFGEERVYDKGFNKITISPDGSAVIEMESLWNLDDSIKTRNVINSLNNKEREDFYHDFITEFAGDGEIIHCELNDLDERFGTIKSYTKARYPNKYKVVDGMIIIDFLGYSNSSSFVAKERKNNIFYPINSLEESTIIYEIPEGFRISHIPENYDLDIGYFKTSKEYTRKGNTIAIKRSERFRRKEIPKEDYQKVQSFFKELPNKTRQRIVLKRIHPVWQEIKDLFGYFRGK